LGRLHIRVRLWWESRWSCRLLVVTGARCPLTKPVVTAVELRVDHRAPLQSRRAARRFALRVCRYSASRLPEVRGVAGAQAASASCASCRSGSIYIYIGLCAYVVQREPTPGRRSGVGLAPRPQALPVPAAALILYMLLPYNYVGSIRPTRCPRLRSLNPHRNAPPTTPYSCVRDGYIKRCGQAAL
jgi:hypothetical protein